VSRFYFSLWLKWILRLTLCSVALASVFSALLTAFVYANQGAQTLGSAVWMALFDIFKFWFAIFWSLALLVALFRSLKFVFNSCANGYKLVLQTCANEEKSETIEVVGYGDLIKVWRKWFMGIIWLVGVQMILALIFTTFFTSYSAVFDWFGIHVLYVFVLIAGYFSFASLSGRCKLTRVRKC
jgi:hypothetical protein